MTAGSRKGCGCGCDCECGKTPAKQTNKDKWFAAEKPWETKESPDPRPPATTPKAAPTKKALVGNQNQLPQHLQNAIKAAPGKMYNSPNKMWGAAKVAHGKKKSPAKMGCYGKKK